MTFSWTTLSLYFGITLKRLLPDNNWLLTFDLGKYHFTWFITGNERGTK